MTFIETVTKAIDKNKKMLGFAAAAAAVGLFIGVIWYLYRRGSLRLPAVIQSMLGDAPFTRPAKRTIIDPADRYLTPDATSGPVEIPGRAAYAQHRTSDPA